MNEKNIQQMDGIINQQQLTPTTMSTSSRSNQSSPDYAQYQQNSIITAAQNLAFLLQQQQSSSPIGVGRMLGADTNTMETISKWLENQLPVCVFSLKFFKYIFVLKLFLWILLTHFSIPNFQSSEKKLA